MIKYVQKQHFTFTNFVTIVICSNKMIKLLMIKVNESRLSKKLKQDILVLL